MSNISYYWRILATSFCFSSFGIGGLLLSLTVFPVFNILPVSNSTKKRLSQRVVHHGFRFFVWQMQFVGVLKVEVSGVDKLYQQRSHLLIANHPSIIDVVVLISLMKEADCVVKDALWKNPLLGGAVRAAGYINNSTPEQLISDCVEAINNGRSLIIFPEGTRTTPGSDYKFQRGAANIAVRSNKDLLPATIICRPSSLTKQDRWYNIPKEGPVNIKIRFGDEIEIFPFINDADSAPIASRRLTQFLQDYYQKEVFAND